ncbi:unnamed protein product [Hapterophycus canaliculatus]
MSGLSDGLEGARHEYASSKVIDLSTQLQEISVAKFEVQHSRREVYVKRGNLLYLTPRPEAEARLQAREKDVGEKLANMQAVAAASDPHAG